MRKAIVLSLVFVPGALAVVGCDVFLPPGPEAVLEGTWLLKSNDDTSGADLLLIFDNRGNLVQLRLASGAVTVNQAVRGRSTLDGSNVTITLSAFALSLNFAGTLSADNNVMTGTITTHISLGGTQIGINNGTATLTRQ